MPKWTPSRQPPKRPPQLSRHNLNLVDDNKKTQLTGISYTAATVTNVLTLPPAQLILQAQITSIFLSHQNLQPANSYCI